MPQDGNELFDAVTGYAAAISVVVGACGASKASNVRAKIV